MMAFFLLMWLINVTSPEQKTGIAEYFNPITVSQRTSGSGGVLDGTSVSAPGPLNSPNAQVTIDTPTPFAPRSEKTTKGGIGATEAEKAAQEKAAQEKEAKEKAAREKEERQFEAVAEKLRKSIEEMPELAGLLQNLLIDETQEGLRIQLVDRDERPMFPLGSAEPFDYTRQMLALVTQAIAGLPNKVSIRGHTDSLPYADGRRYDNWDLSSARALASRRTMTAAGLTEDRVEGVVGRADRDPLFPATPEDPRNRRISIILLHDHPPAAEVGDTAAVEPAAAPETPAETIH
jgi:chemotaxis protein MotB